MKVFVTRDKAGIESDIVHIRLRKPEKASTGIKGNFYFYGTHVFKTTKRLFKQCYGYTPKKGSCEQRNLTLTPIE